ncbi:MAG: zinc-binding protein [Bdellovibrio sp. ArHS]|nr:MAG: zinc-binding protein [Bdellovibrio sp. ArHS]
MPLVYSCSGCSSAAQMANALAVRLDRAGLAEMSCIAGVGGGVKPLVKKAGSTEDIIVIDGCPLKCSVACLKNQNLKPKVEIELSQWGVAKTYHQDFSEEEMQASYLKVVELIKQSF